MSRSSHPRGRSRKLSEHRRKNKEWGQDSTWKPAERKVAAPKKKKPKRRSPRKRLKK